MCVAARVVILRKKCFLLLGAFFALCCLVYGCVSSRVLFVFFWVRHLLGGVCFFLIWKPIVLKARFESSLDFRGATRRL